VLLVLRAEPPEQDLWSVPGGRAEHGEALVVTVAREVLEETGLEIVVGRELGTLEVETGTGEIYEIHDFAASVAGGHLMAGDDAADAGWFTREQIVALRTTRNLAETLDRYGMFTDP
jgi:8-oxo-dGTP diphosphatase